MSSRYTQKNKFLLIFIGLMFGSSEICAQFEYEGISLRYSSDYSGLEVIKSLSGSYSGDVVIPSEAPYSNKKYPIKSIASTAFNGDSITSITIPATIEHIGVAAFYDCDYLQKVYCLGEEPVYFNVVGFFGPFTTKLGTLYVPSAAREKYMNAVQWSDFYNITGNNNTKPYHSITFNTSTEAAIMIDGNLIKLRGIPIRKDFEEGDDVTIEIFPKYCDYEFLNSMEYEGYIDKVLIDRDDITDQLSDNTFIIHNIQKDHHFNITISPYPPLFYINQSKEGSFSIAQQYETYFQLKLEPADGYEVDSVLINSRDETNYVDNWSEYNYYLGGYGGLLNSDAHQTLTVRFRRKEGNQ